MKQILIDDKVISFDTLKATSRNHLTNEALLLANDWLNGTNSFVFHSSGSTGTPKEINLSRKQISYSIVRSTIALGLTANDHFLCCLSVKSIAGAMMVFRALELGADITIVTVQSDPLSHIELDHPYTLVSLVPLQLFGLESKPEHIIKLNRFKTVLVGGAKINAVLAETLEKCENTIYETYGMTETVSHVALKKIGRDKVFHLLDGIQAKVDERGCLTICADVTNNQWLATNDCVEFVSPHSFIVTGRIDNVINSGGIKVQAEKVEASLSLHLPSINYFIIGLPNQKLGEQVTLVVEGKQPITLEELKDRTQHELTTYEFPKQLLFIETFKRTESGKVDKRGSIELKN